ncbi:hypothetical protein OAA27_00970 [bacterium]|nr:hypothetical protein [bacterium]
MKQNRFQIGIGSMLLLMLVFSMMSAGFFYASRVDAIQNELNSLVSNQVSTGDQGSGRLPHIIFIMFTFTSPLILAGVLATAVSVLRWRTKRR